MTAVRRTFVLGLAVLLAAATAAANTVVTADEVISCSVVTASADSVRLTLRKGRARTLPAWDIYEVRVVDSGRVAEMTSLLPQARVMLDSGQPVQPREVRILEAMRLRLDRARDAREQGIPWSADVVDTLALGSSPAKMTTRCLEMNALLHQ